MIYNPRTRPRVKVIDIYTGQELKSIVEADTNACTVTSVTFRGGRKTHRRVTAFDVVSLESGQVIDKARP